jgi:hypothetical protein
MKKPKPPSAGPMLVNKLSVKDARHLLKHEGGEATRVEYALQLAFILITAGFSARAILWEGATVWHLLLPGLAQYLALLVFIPVCQAFFHLPGMRREVIKSYGNLAFWCVAGGVSVFVRAAKHQISPGSQWAQDTAWLASFIMETGMLWPMISAAAGMAISLPARFRTFRDHGPPFVSVSLGCAARIVILFLGLFLLPLLLAHSGGAPWFLWTALLLGDLLGLIVIWDIRRRLRRLDARQNRAGAEEG